jgi:putative ABC transport system permease protein
MGTAADLTYWQVGLAAALIGVNAAISLVLRLGLGRRLLVAAARMVVQLLLVGQVLRLVFDHATWYVVVSLALVMVAAAAAAAVGRVGRRYPGALLDCLLSIWASSWVLMAYALFVVVQAEPWYAPRYAIPVLGMILGNMLSGVSLGLERLGEELVGQRARVETLLALGATRWEAARQAVRQAVRTGMIPTLNSMLVMGVVSLPGMMTGQILAEGEPTKAVKYQIVIMFLIAAGTALGLLGVLLLGFRRLFSARHQFLYGRLAEKG